MPPRGSLPLAQLSHRLELCLGPKVHELAPSCCMAFAHRFQPVGLCYIVTMLGLLEQRYSMSGFRVS